jgi:hypothetical protein
LPFEARIIGVGVLSVKPKFVFSNKYLLVCAGAKAVSGAGVRKTLKTIVPRDLLETAKSGLSFEHG